MTQRMRDDARQPTLTALASPADFSEEGVDQSGPSLQSDEWLAGSRVRMDAGKERMKGEGKTGGREEVGGAGGGGAKWEEAGRSGRRREEVAPRKFETSTDGRLRLAGA